MSLLIVCMYGILSYNYKTEEVQQADFDLSLLDRNVSIEEANMDSQVEYLRCHFRMWSDGHPKR